MRKKQTQNGDSVVAARPSAEELERMAVDARIERNRLAKEDCQLTVVKLAPVLSTVLGQFQRTICEHMSSQGFWECDNTGEKIALMHSELSEALEADRKDLDSNVMGFTGVEEELADTIIRILDFAGYHDLDLAGAISAKILVNLERPFKHGKKY